MVSMEFLTTPKLSYRHILTLLTDTFLPEELISMAARKNYSQPRDTAKDVILGLTPSGQGARQPKEGVVGFAQPGNVKAERATNDRVPYHVKKPSSGQLYESLQESSDPILDYHGSTQLVTTSPYIRVSDYAEIRQQISSNRENVLSMSHEINKLRSVTDLQLKNLMIAVEELKRKPSVDALASCSAEIKGLHEKIRATENSILRDTADRQSKLGEDLSNRFLTIENALKSQSGKLDKLDLKVANDIAGRVRAQEEQIENLNKKLADELAKQKSRFHQINEALLSFEKNIEHGRSKIDTTINEEIQRRKLHERSLVSRIGSIEERLNLYIGTTLCTIIVFKIRREMQAIAADKGKVNMEGLLLLEQRVTRAQSELQQNQKELSRELGNLDDNDAVKKLKNRVAHLASVSDHMTSTQEQIREKVDKQIPKDLNDLAAKTDNITKQLLTRLNKEEEERFLAIKELQEAFQKLQLRDSSSNGGTTSSSNKQLQRELDECKVAIKKLAESVTTVKNVLDKKITDESRKVLFSDHSFDTC
ncbi:hypothetical protein GCK32_000832 [Trichostrongylus colubriformis]|uniref:Uncharacterized protein n=1 Tax=Trichostrongylus colubriformis TaxID=6319 RepID=A0AAN8G581_TRICO